MYIGNFCLLLHVDDIYQYFHADFFVLLLVGTLSSAEVQMFVIQINIVHVSAQLQSQMDQSVIIVLCEQNIQCLPLRWIHCVIPKNTQSFDNSHVVVSIIFLELCSSRKYPYSPHRRDWNFLGVKGSVRPKDLKI